MSLLTNIQNVALELNLPEVEFVVGVTDKTIRQFRALSNRAGKELRDTYTWPQLTKEYTFTTVSAQDSYALPIDFNFDLFQTHWDRTNHWQLRGPTTPSEWQQEKSGISNITPRRQFRVKGVTDKQFFVNPTPTANGDTLVFEYSSRNWIRPIQWAASQSYTTTSYTWNNGNIYFTTAGGFTGATPPTHTSGTVSDGGVSWAFQNIVYEDFLADTDVSLLDEELLELSIKWRMMHTKGLQWQEFRDQYERKLRRKRTAFESAPILNIAALRSPWLISAASVPDSGFGV